MRYRGGGTISLLDQVNKIQKQLDTLFAGRYCECGHTYEEHESNGGFCYGDLINTDESAHKCACRSFHCSTW